MAFQKIRNPSAIPARSNVRVSPNMFQMDLVIEQLEFNCFSHQKIQQVEV
jgi:hypothetical protein